MANDNENESALYSIATYTGDGTTNSFVVPFPYLYVEDVHVFVDGTEISVYPVISHDDPPSPYLAHWYADNIIKFTDAPVEEATIRIIRLTNKLEPEVQFTNSAILTEEDLNIIATQLLYIVQETYDNFGAAYSDIAIIRDEILEKYDDVILEANNAIETAQEAAGMAASSAEDAEDYADAASGYADTASGYADDASDYADAAANSASQAQAIVDDISVIATGSTESRSIADRFGEIINVKDFGAVGDGITNDTVAIENAVVAATSRNVPVYGNGLVYAVTSIPDFTGMTKIAFKKDGMIYPSADFFDIDYAKISDGGMYTAWPEDKAYVLGDNAIRVWCMTGRSHRDSKRDIVCLTSTDGGSTWGVPTYLGKEYQGWTVWSAGTDGDYEYLIVEDGDRVTSEGDPVTWYLFKRAAPQGSSEDSYTDTNPWAITEITFPMPDWETDDTTPVMIHSFCVSNNKIVVGGSFTNGCGLYYSSDSGATWTFVSLAEGTTYEEPTVKYDDGVFCGFIRSGNDGNHVCWWYSDDDLETVTVTNAPSGFFGANGLQDACIEFAIVDGDVYAFTAQRDGTLAGTGDDRVTPLYFIKGKAVENFWANAEIYTLGYLDHYETGGASACGQGSVVRFRDKIFYFFGNEELFGKSVTRNYNRIANIYSICIRLEKKVGLLDTDSHLANNRASLGGICSDFSNRTYLPVGQVVCRNSTIPSAVFTSFTEAGLIVDGGAGNRDVLLSTSKTNAAPGYVVRGISSNKLSGIRVFANLGDVGIYSENSSRIRYRLSSKALTPEDSAGVALGMASRKWTELFADTDVINTSDERRKSSIESFPDAVLDAWGDVNWCQFKYNEAIAKKGLQLARIHSGLIAQRIDAVFKAHGLDASRYGLFCYDEWDEEQEIIDANGNIISPALDAGNAYSLRYTEALAMEAAYQRRRADRLEARMERLEQKINQTI